MFDKPTSTHVIGLEKDGLYFRAARVVGAKGKVIFGPLFEIEIPSQEEIEKSVNPLYNSKEGKELDLYLNQDLSVTALNADEVLIRTLDLKLKKESDIQEVLLFQAEPLLPYSIENALVDRMTLYKNNEGTRLTLVSARKDHVETHLKFWDQFDVEPEVISCEPAALSFFSKYFTSTSELHFIIYLAKEHTTIVLVKQGKLLAAQSTMIGSDLLKKGNVQEEEEWLREVTRIFFSIQKLRKEGQVEEILLLGQDALIEALSLKLVENTGKKLLQIREDLSSLEPTRLREYAVCIGAALSALPFSKEQINFRQQEFSHRNPWKRVKKPLFTYLSLCAVFATSVLLLGSSYLGHLKDQLRQEYVDLLGVMNKSHDVFEQEYRHKSFKESLEEEEIFNPKQLSLKEINQRLLLLEKEVKETPDLFVLQPQVPRVSDFLAWLNTQPTVVGKEGQSLRIESFNYSFVKRPEQKKKQEKYQVKVELEFSSPTPKMAREFHDMLIGVNEMVDSKNEVKWGVVKNNYKTSFYLKDKTLYPVVEN